MGEPDEACRCMAGFCRLSVLLDGFGDAVMAGDTEAIARIEAEYKRQEPKCRGGFRAVPPPQSKHGEPQP